MNLKISHCILVWLAPLCWAGPVISQTPGLPPEHQSAHPLAASPAYPFGQVNESADPELSRFSFMIGRFERRERRRNPATGQWSGWGPGRKKAIWIMNGTAILDEHINDQTGENVVFIRTFDSIRSVWHHVRVSMPDYRLTEAEGGFKGEEYFNESNFTDANGDEVFQQYIFYDIKKDGYKWRAERTIKGNKFSYWEIEYSRRNTDVQPPEK